MSTSVLDVYRKNWPRGIAAMRLGKLCVTAATIAQAPSAHADVDTDFADELHGYGIYGPRDYNPWLLIGIDFAQDAKGELRPAVTFWRGQLSSSRSERTEGEV